VPHVLLQRLAAALAAAGLLLLASSASAWIELSVKSDNATIDLESNGAAVVSHEILLRVRGGPFKGLSVVGVDPDALPLPETSLASATSGRASGPEIPLVAMVENGELQLTIEGGSRVGAGQYVLKLAYQTQLLSRGLIEPRNGQATLRWVGPRFNDGIDSMRVVFRLPHGSQPPRVPDADPAGGQLGIVAEYDGVFLSDYRRADDKDELEVVRPHVAKGEPVVWRVQFDAASVGLGAKLEQTPMLEPKVSQPPVFPSTGRRLRLGDLWLIVLSGLSYGLLVYYKARSMVRATARHGGTARPLVPWGPRLRALLAALSISLASGLLLLSPLPLLSAPLLVWTMALATELAPSTPSPRRGPGSWRNLSAKQAFARQSLPLAPGRWLDVGTLPGLGVLVLVLAGLSWLAARQFSLAAPRGVSIVIEMATLLPLFFTGRAVDLPAPGVTRARPLLRGLFRRLRREAGVHATMLGRFPQEQEHPDELRLLMMPHKALLGLNAIEVACEFYPTPFGLRAALVVLVRVSEGSPAYEALAHCSLWSRGRTPGERAAVLRPRVPTVANTQALLCQLRERLSVGSGVARSAPLTGVAPVTPRKPRQKGAIPVKAVTA
jgi:hypothetical protein